MRVLLDTHAFLWAVVEPRKLSRKAREILRDDATEVVVSTASAWEIATKYRLGRLPGAAAVMSDYAAAIRGLKCEELEITRNHALLAGRFTQLHRDPFDRILAAQAQIEQLTLISCDPALAQFGIEPLW